MKQINNYIQEKLKLNKSIIKKHQNLLTPKTTEELIEMIKKEIKQNGVECSLNHIDVSEITEMDGLFSHEDLEEFDGDISDWDVSNVKSMHYMFGHTQFTGKNSDLNKWNISKVKDMSVMFIGSHFNSDISSWNVSEVYNLSSMFEQSHFNQDISEWKINSACDTYCMFFKCPIEDENRPFKNGKMVK